MTVGGAPARKPSAQVSPADPVHVVEAGPRWASRGAHKLSGALQALDVAVSGRPCLDAGASTGGFTDVLLRAGAARVVAADVGYGQLVWRLRSDDRVTVLERTNVRHLEPGDVPGPPPELVVADLSFISLTLVLPALRRVATPDADFVLLVKPQFEAGRGAVGRGGVVRDPSVWRAALHRVAAAAAALGLGVAGASASPLPGPSGNVEFFVHLRAGAVGDAEALLDAAVREGPGSPLSNLKRMGATAEPVRTVGFIVHGGRPEARRAAAEASEQFRRFGVKVVGSRPDGWEHDAVELRGREDFCAGVDLVLVFGGDGTFLRAAFLARDHRVPLLGVDLGRLGFLTELDEDRVAQAIPRLAAGEFAVEERMTLEVRVLDAAGQPVGGSWVLNEASIERTVPQRLIVLEVRVGDTAFARVPADAVIVATPTGSTAYAFSAGGPLLSPLVDAIVLTPVAPHSLFDRTMVVDPAESLSVSPVDSTNPCVVSLDGRESIPVPVGGSVRVARGDQPVRIARLEPFDFYARVREKFRLDT